MTHKKPRVLAGGNASALPEVLCGSRSPCALPTARSDATASHTLVPTTCTTMSPSSERQDAPDAPRRASIPLAHKRVPTEMRSPADHASLLFAALIGDVDISALRAYVTSLPSESWQEEHNRKRNVFFQRPFHDKLGVENIMCVFSDTQLENVFTLPRYEEFRKLLEPIFAQMNVKSEQVRCIRGISGGERVANGALTVSLSPRTGRALSVRQDAGRDAHPRAPR